MAGLAADNQPVQEPGVNTVTTRSRPWRHALTAIVLAVAVSAGGAGGWAGYLRLTGNIHEVERGMVYRSGQLGANQLATLIRAHHIRTVVSLRGENPGQSWYDAEVATTAAAGVKLVSLPMSADNEPGEALLASLLQVLATAERPLLIHCEAGADRTGLAAALYELVNMRQPPERADAQLSFRYGHFPWLTSRTGAMDRTFWRVASGLAEKG
jgi:protein tyrosine phosphatase (PTP) superfamily phosphohydrolase (DUF442 family)